MIVVQNLWRKFSEFVATRGISSEVAAGEIFAIYDTLSVPL